MLLNTCSLQTAEGLYYTFLYETIFLTISARKLNIDLSRVLRQHRKPLLFESFFTAANFLGYAESLKLVRAANVASALNATSGNTGILIKNDEDYDNTYKNMSAAKKYGMFVAKYAGDLGNSLRVSVWADQDSVAYSHWQYNAQFDGVTGTSAYVADKLGSNDEMHVIVVDRLGKFSNGEANTVLERFPYISKAADAVNDDGSSNFWVNVVNGNRCFRQIVKKIVEQYLRGEHGQEF